MIETIEIFLSKIHLILIELICWKFLANWEATLRHLLLSWCLASEMPRQQRGWDQPKVNWVCYPEIIDWTLYYQKAHFIF